MMPLFLKFRGDGFTINDNKLTIVKIISITANVPLDNFQVNNVFFVFLFFNRTFSVGLKVAIDWWRCDVTHTSRSVAH